MNTVHHKIGNFPLGSWFNSSQQQQSLLSSSRKKGMDLLSPARKWLDNVEVKNSSTAHRICKSIPSQCPFEREIKFLGHTIVKIPPMCKLNPLYNEVIGLRFRAICYLADVCGEDVSVYC
jgi:hypothetical protein